MQGVASGVLRGAGKQLVGAVANVISFYVIGIPLAWLFCFTFSLGVNGLLLGVGCGTAFQVAVLITLIYKYEAYVFAPTVSDTKDTYGDYKPVSLAPGPSLGFDGTTSESGMIALTTLSGVNCQQLNIDTDSSMASGVQSHGRGILDAAFTRGNFTIEDDGEGVV